MRSNHPMSIMRTMRCSGGVGIVQILSVFILEPACNPPRTATLLPEENRIERDSVDEQ
jgi:hypothetical protein